MYTRLMLLLAKPITHFCKQCTNSRSVR